MKIGKTLLLVGAVAAGAYAVARFIGREKVVEKVSDAANVAVGKATELLNVLLTKYDEATQGAYVDPDDEKEDPWRSATTFNGNDARDDDNEEARR